MIYRVLGEKHFQEGLQLYFSRHKYGNTRTIDLWNAWKEVSGQPIDKMMSSWTEQMGFPMLEILNDPLSTGQVELKQSWFLADGSKEAGDDSKAWFCPIIIGTDKGEAPVSFLEQKTGKVDCANLKGASFMKLNFGQHVPVRVLYPEAVFKRMVQNLKSIPATDRIGLLSDTFATCKAGALDAGFMVDLLSGFTDELNPHVWSELSSVLGGLEKIICQGLDDDTASAFQDGSVMGDPWKGIQWTKFLTQSMCTMQSKHVFNRCTAASCSFWLEILGFCEVSICREDDAGTGNCPSRGKPSRAGSLL